MIRIQVLSRQGVPPAQPMSASFGPEGGTIGRSETNALVLEDSDRTVSRVQAQVLYRDGRYFLVDQGSNPLHCNGQPLGSGSEVELHGGERLAVGSFELEVVVAPSEPLRPSVVSMASTASFAAEADDPFADLLAGLAPPAMPSSRTPPQVSPPPALLGNDDLLGIPPSGGKGLALDPFADLSSGQAALPADDFSGLGLPAASAPTAHAQRIDELFGGFGGRGLGADPLALSPLADPLLQPNTASKDDPLAAFGEVQAAPQAARSDHLPIGQFGFTPPRAAPSASPNAPMSKAGPEPSAAPVPLDDADVRFDDQTGQPIRIVRAPAVRPREPLATAAPKPSPALPPAEGHGHEFGNLLGGLSPAPASGLDDFLTGLPTVSGVTPSAAAPATVPAERSDASPLPPVAPAPAPVAAVPTTTPSAVTPALQPAGAGAMHGDELLDAFLRGLGPMHQAPNTLTPALMERIGSLLRCSTEGTLQLLLTRQELKREVRAEVTMIAAQANNPLKFSPTADVALTHLLGPGMRGFMPAEAAMRDAYNDLRAHQFGVIVGMRAALTRLIARFGPDELEKKIAARSAIDSLFAANRKAKLWDQFTALYSTIASEAEDDFHALFGKAFLEAYEEQMARLKSDGGPTP